MANLTKRNIFLFLIFAAMFFVARKFWRMDFPITDFDNLILGMATSKNIDISKAILWYALYAVPLCLLFAWQFNSSALYDKAKNFLSKIKINQSEENIFLGLIFFSFLILSVKNFIIFNFACAICFILIWIFANDKETTLFAWLSTIYIFSIPAFYLSQYFASIEEILAGLMIGAGVLLSFVKNFQAVFSKLYPFLLAGIADYILLNVLEISLVRGFTINDQILIAPYVLAIIACIFLKSSAEKNYEQKILRGTLILIIFSFTPALGNGGYIDFFEGANHGLSIAEFSRSHAVPLIDNLDAHMLFYTLGGIIYFILSGDTSGIIMAPYAMIIFMLIGAPGFLFFLQKFLSEKQSLIVFAIFPFGGINTIFPGFIALAAFFFWKKTPNFLRSVAVIATVSFLCLYRIDLGVSFGFALFFCPLLFCIFNRQKKILAQYILATVIYSATFFVIVFYCLDFEFAKSFLSAFSSNQHWAYCELGNFLQVFAVYFFLPIVISILILPVIQKLLQRYEDELSWSIIFLYATFIFGFPRMIVRHTFIELATATYAAEIFLFTLLLIKICPRCKAAIFTGIFLTFIASVMPNNQSSTILQLLQTNVSLTSVHIQQKQSFAYFNEDDKKQIELMKNFCAENLQPDETYFDFTNQSLFFAFTGKKNPIYINQCPAMINGTAGQLQALEQMKNSKIKFVIMPFLQRENFLYSGYTMIDWILNSDRYYLLTEYIAKNYQPYQPLGNFFVWQEKNSEPPQNLNYNYELPENHFHNLRNIPYLWGKSSRQFKDTEIDPNNLKNIAGKTGFLALEISSDANFETHIIIHGEGINDIIYLFKVKQGTHVYKFRVSSDILWYSGKIKNLDTGNLSVKLITFQEVEK